MQFQVICQRNTVHFVVAYENQMSHGHDSDLEGKIIRLQLPDLSIIVLSNCYQVCLVRSNVHFLVYVVKHALN